MVSTEGLGDLFRAGRTDTRRRPYLKDRRRRVIGGNFSTDGDVCYGHICIRDVLSKATTTQGSEVGTGYRLRRTVSESVSTEGPFYPCREHPVPFGP